MWVLMRDGDTSVRGRHHGEAAPSCGINSEMNMSEMAARWRPVHISFARGQRACSCYPRINRNAQLNVAVLACRRKMLLIHLHQNHKNSQLKTQVLEVQCASLALRLCHGKFVGVCVAQATANRTTVRHHQQALSRVSHLETESSESLKSSHDTAVNDEYGDRGGCGGPAAHPDVSVTDRMRGLFLLSVNAPRLSGERLRTSADGCLEADGYREE